MTPAQAFEELIVARFSRLYGDPICDNVELFYADYRKALAGTSAEILAEASDAVVKAHEYRNWPTIGECVKAVHAVAERRAVLRVQPAEPPRREPSAAEKARIAKLLADCKAAINPINRQPQPGALLASDRLAWERRYGRQPS